VKGKKVIKIELTPEHLERGDGGVYPLDRYPKDHLDEIVASHVLEHFDHSETLNIVSHWISKLKPGGWLKIAVPDFEKCIEPYIRGQKTNMADYIMGGQKNKYDYHKSLFDNKSLTAIMQYAGLIDLKLWKSDANDCAALPISLNIMGQKPICGIKEPGPKIRAIMSMPRLAFTDNMFCAMQALLDGHRIPLERGVGVFWDQCLTRMMESHLNDGTEFILTIDYDTWFTGGHITKLVQLMIDHPAIDALVPVQIRREDDSMLIAVDGPAEQKEVVVSYKTFQKPLMEIGTGHFGLSLFRVSMLRQLAKPWFVGVPGPDNSWNEGRQDPDIYFWNQLRRQGFKACQANEVKVGHLQMMCTFPERFPTGAGQGMGAIHVYMNDLQKNGPPLHCVPDVEHLK
jgi:hypothetical protein